MRSRRSLKLSHTQTSVPCGTLNKNVQYHTVYISTQCTVLMVGSDTLAHPRLLHFCLNCFEKEEKSDTIICTVILCSMMAGLPSLTPKVPPVGGRFMVAQPF